MGAPEPAPAAVPRARPAAGPDPGAESGADDDPEDDETRISGGCPAVDSGQCLLRAVRSQVRQPARVAMPRSDDPPGQARRWRGLMPHPPPQFGDVAVGLRVVAAAAGRHDVVPGVLPATTARNDVVDAGCDATAVHASAAVTGEQGAAGERHGAAEGHADEAFQAYDARGGYGLGGAVHQGAGILQAYRLSIEDEDERAAERYDAERLVRRVEDQDMRHGASLYVGGAWLAPGRSPPVCPASRWLRHHDRVTR